MTNGQCMTARIIMSTAERKERERLQRYNSILDAAEEIFFIKGFKRATVEQIAKKAQLSKGAIYLYFKSKELIYIGIAIRANNLLRSKFIEAAKGGHNGLEKTARIGQAYYDFAQEYPNYFRVMSFVERFDSRMFEKIKHDPLATEAHDSGQAILKVLADVIQGGIDDGSIRDSINPMRAAVQLWAQSNGVIQLAQNWRCHVKTHDIDLGDPFLDFQDFTRRSLASKEFLKC